MATHKVEKPLHVGKEDTYSLTINDNPDGGWLNGEAITSVTVTADSAYITVGTTSIVDNIMYVYLTGVSSKMASEVHFDYTTATRSDCDYINVDVEDC